eukprot:UN1679
MHPPRAVVPVGSPPPDRKSSDCVTLLASRALDLESEGTLRPRTRRGSSIACAGTKPSRCGSGTAGRQPLMPGIRRGERPVKREAVLEAHFLRPAAPVHRFPVRRRARRRRRASRREAPTRRLWEPMPPAQAPSPRTDFE